MSWNRNTQGKTVGRKIKTGSIIGASIYAANKIETETKLFSKGAEKVGNVVTYGVEKAGKARTAAGNFATGLADAYRDGRKPRVSGFKKFKDRVKKIGGDIAPKITEGANKIKSMITPESPASKLARSKAKLMSDSIKNAVLPGSSNTQLLYKSSNVGQHFLKKPAEGKAYVDNLRNPLQLSKYNPSTPKSVIAEVNKKRQNVAVKAKQTVTKTPKVITTPAPKSATWTSRVIKGISKTNTYSMLAPLFTPTIMGMKQVNKQKNGTKSKTIHF